MKRIIELPDKVVKAIQNGENYRYDIHTAIAQSKPIDKSGDLISREWLREEFIKSKKITFEERMKIACIVDSAPTVEPKELKPLVDKVVEVLPELKNAIIEEIPKLVSGEIKCSKCSYYINTFDYIPKPKGEWITNKEYIDKRYNGHYDGSCFNSPYNCSHCGYSPKDDRPNYCPDCGADMRKVERGIFNESKM